MKDRDSIKLLKECDAGSKMAVTSLDDVLEKVENENLKALLCETKEHHAKLGNEIHALLTEYGCEEKGVSRICVPRTMESSTSSSFLPSIISGTGICFISAMRLRISWLEGVKERAQVGVYLMKGRAKGLCEALE